jgi:phosphoribosylanthranilate isomerase
VQPAIKFCGLTRPVDAGVASELGAEYVGVVFAESPRRLAPAEAREVYAAAAGAQPVAVFGAADTGVLASQAREVGSRIVQLHGRVSASDVESLRATFDGEIWAVVRVGDAAEPITIEVFELTDAVVLDTADARLLGGTGRTFNWTEAAECLAVVRRPRKLVLAGGLRPSNVGDAIRLLQPDVVDVSSGVESSPGIKNHALMRAFVEAVAESGHR